jgi:hypothetical protein
MISIVPDSPFSKAPTKVFEFTYNSNAGTALTVL